MIDVDHHISTTRRTVGTRELDAGQARVTTISRVYPTDPQDLWDACTNAERIPRWFLPVTGELRPGGRYQLEGNAGGRIEACDPPQRFTATWEYGDQVSWIEVRIEAAGDGRARLVLEHVGHVDDESWATYGPGATGIGWDLGLLGLQLHLEGGGVAVDPAEVGAWTASESGRRFIGEASRAWAQAGIADGTDPETANAAAANATAFYTGGA